MIPGQTPDGDAVLYELAGIRNRLDHLDTMVHELHQVLVKYGPLLEVVSARIDTGSAWRRWKSTGNGQHARTPQ